MMKNKYKDIIDFISNCYSTANFYKNNNTSNSNYSINSLIEDAYNRFNSILDEETKKKLLDNNLSSLTLNFTRLKTNAMFVWLKDLINELISCPISYETTTIADLDEELTEELVVDIINTTLLSNDDDINIEEVVKNLKNYLIKKQKTIADNALKKIYLIIKDKLIESNFRSEFSSFLFNVSLYPFAVFEGPVITSSYIKKYKSNKLVTEKKDINKYYNIDVRDVFFSSDCKDLSTCSFVILNKKYDYLDLKNMLDSKSDFYVKSEIKSILDIIEDAIDNKTSINLDNDFKTLQDIYSKSFASIDNNIYTEKIKAYKFYGKIPGILIKDFLDKKQNKYQYYEIEAIVINKYLVKLDIKDEMYIRPVFGCSFQQQDENVFWGYGIARLIADIDDAIQTQFRGLILNSRLSFAPSFEGIQQYMVSGTNGKPFTLTPGKIIPVRANLTGNGFPVYYAHHTPNITNAITPIISYLSNFIDLFSCIPSVEHGNPGSGSARSAKRLIELYNNALKVIINFFRNIDEKVLKKMGEILYYQVINDNETPNNYKSDANIVVNGLTGIIEKELKADELEVEIQKLISLNSQGLIDDTILKDKIKELLSGMSDYVVDDVENVEKQQNQQFSNEMLQNSNYNNIIDNNLNKNLYKN